MTFVERPHENEKNRALSYVAKLLDEAKKSKEERSEDIKELEKIQKLLSTKKYGLVWEHHAEEVEEKMKTKIPVFLEDKSNEIHNNLESKDFNFLLEGDNLHSLHLLKKTHADKIDVIYIDPPYNTGSEDFSYNDNFVLPDDNFKHSKWLSFMKCRLDIAASLLAEDGIIFISIDENEYANLKILCDEVFGGNNRLLTFHMQVRYSDKTLNEKNDWQPIMEYVLLYAKNKNKFRANKPQEKYSIDKFIFEFVELTEGAEFEVKGRKVTVFKKGEWRIKKHKIPATNLLKETWVSGSIYSGTGNGTMVQNVIEPRINLDGLGSLYKIDGLGEDGLGYRYFVGPQRAGASRSKMYSGIPISRSEELVAGEATKYKSIPNLFDFSADFGNIRHEGGVAFNSGKKPIKMLKQLINYHGNKEANILDFFAGSGSTGHAVLALNAEDQGNRKFILATNDEVIDTTYQRMQHINKNLPMNLKYFKTDFIDKQAEDIEKRLLVNVKTLIELKHGIDLNDSDVAIVTKRSDISELDLSTLSIIYMRSQTHKMLDRQQLEELKEIKIIDIPETFFPLEMKEAGL